VIPTPPLLVRRLVVAPVVLLLEAAVVLASPLLALIALVMSPVLGGRRPLRVLAMAVGYSARHIAATVACLGLWVTSGFGIQARSDATQRAHYSVLRWFVGGVYRSMTRMAGVTVQVTESEAAEKVLSSGRRPVVVLSRHAGEGDSLLVLHQLLCCHSRRPRVVLHQALRLDPLIDVLGRRLPNRFIDPRGGDTEVEIAAMTQGLGDDDAVLIFPEGGNFSPARRQRAIDRLEQAGHEEEARWAREMEHVAAPRPGGAIAALEAAPHADVVFVGHVGVPAGLHELWHGLNVEPRVQLRLWLVSAQDIPSDRDERIDWLFGWWRTVDGWVGQRLQHGTQLSGCVEPLGPG
jgi:1-acyl-sn-glycerol-3-phosphate acyltransferase